MSIINPFQTASLPQLKSPPIELIVGQVRVPMIPTLLEPDGINAFHRLAKTEYPHLRSEKQVEIRLSRDEAPQGESVRLWRLEDIGREWTLTVSPDFVAIEVKEYRSFLEFKDRLIQATLWLQEAYECTLRVRVGLRYVDRFNSQKFNVLGPGWLRHANPNLLALAKLAPKHEQRTFMEHRLSLGDRWGLTLRVTILSMGETDQGGDEFVTDIDGFNEDEVGFEDLGTVLDRLKDVDYSAFSWAADSLVNQLEHA